MRRGSLLAGLCDMGSGTAAGGRIAVRGGSSAPEHCGALNDLAGQPPPPAKRARGRAARRTHEQPHAPGTDWSGGEFLRITDPEPCGVWSPCRPSASCTASPARAACPSIGVWFDDSWVAAGAILGRPGEILESDRVIPASPCWGWARNVGGRASLRQLGGRRSMPECSHHDRLLGHADLRLQPVGVLSDGLCTRGRVYPHPVLRSGEAVHPRPAGCAPPLVALLPWLARRTWRWPLALGWGLCALAVST